METYLQYHRISSQIEQQLKHDSKDNNIIPCLSRQKTRIFNGRPVLVVEWDSENDPQNPRNWSTCRRICYTLIISSIALAVGAAAPIDSPVLPQAAADLGVSEVTESLAVGIFLIGFGFGALFCGPCSEVLGRSATYIVTLGIFCIFLMASALAPNIGAQLAFRFLAGFSGASPLVCAGGSLSDMWTPLEKTWAFPVFAVAGFGGPTLGPVLSSYIGTSKVLGTWRWSEWIALILSGLVFILTFLFQRETFPPTLLTWKAKHLRKITGDDRYYALHEIDHIPLSRRFAIALRRPFTMAIQEPVIQIITLYLSVLYIILFTFFDGYTYIFTDVYHISQGLTNILFVAMFVGVLLGLIPVPFIYKYTERQMLQNKANGRGSRIEPETRLLFAMAGGAPAIPISLFWMGWTSYPSISIWSPILASTLFGYGVITIFMSSYMYIIDGYEMYAASALTFATFIRYNCAGGMTVVGIPFYRNLGHHWTLTILACISIPLTAVPYVFYRYGHAIRKRSKFAVTSDEPVESESESKE